MVSDADEQGDPGAVEDPDEQVAADVVGAEREAVDAGADRLADRRPALVRER